MIYIIGVLVLTIIVLIAGLVKKKEFDNSEYLKKVKDYDIIISEKEKEKEKVTEELNKIFKQISEYNNSYTSTVNEFNKAKNDLEVALAKKSEVDKQVNELKKFINEFQDTVNKEKEMSKEQLNAIEDNFKKELGRIQEEYDMRAEEYEDKLQDLKQKTYMAIQHNMEEYEREQKIDFYKLKIDENDLNDIKLLRTIEPKLNHKETLGKVIYKVYFEKPYTDLANRVIGKEKVTGIYKITNLKNKMCYVGQAVDVKSRWSQHIKRALNAENRTKNKLYPAMEEFGVENFSFELLEECDKDKLNEREQYYQDYYGAKIFGYSIK